MDQQAIRYDFTAGELKYFLFGKKICPACGGDMEKSKEFEIKLGSDFNSRRGTFLADNEKVKYYTYYFTCRSCGAKYSLRELAK